MTTPTPDADNDRPRGGDGRFVRSADTAERDAEACRLRSRALSYAKIAIELGFRDAATAHRAVQRGLAAIVQEPAEDVRAIELDRLDRMHREVMAVLERQHVTVSNGKVVSRIVGWQEASDGQREPIWEEVLDDAPVLAAVDRLLKIQERRAKLLGLDAPARFGVDAEGLGQEIGDLLTALGGRGDSPAE